MLAMICGHKHLRGAGNSVLRSAAQSHIKLPNMVGKRITEHFYCVILLVFVPMFLSGLGENVWPHEDVNQFNIYRLFIVICENKQFFMPHVQ
jgi:hypothetical protein